ncbi:DUF2442 domain-containing protein [Endothiovibrio diazotrophicus]
MNIVEVTPEEDFVLRVVADDGRIGLFDVLPHLDAEAFTLLRVRSEFEKVRSGSYFIEWDCGADLSADTIEARWKMMAGTGSPERGRSRR